jgi:predicted  nucleic acid-binding Zn-ribbon protein
MSSGSEGTIRTPNRTLFAQQLAEVNRQGNNRPVPLPRLITSEEAEELRREMRTMRGNMDALNAQNRALERRYGGLEAQRVRLRSEVDAAAHKIQTLELKALLMDSVICRKVKTEVAFRMCLYEATRKPN